MLYSYVKTPIRDIAHFSNPKNREQILENRRDRFTHAAFTEDLAAALDAGFEPVTLNWPRFIPKNAFQLQIFEQFSPEAGLELAKCIAALMMDKQRPIPVTFVVRADSETYDLEKEADSFREIIATYRPENVTLGVQMDKSLYSPDSVAKVETLLGQPVHAVSIADGPGHDQDTLDTYIIDKRINLNHPSFTNQEQAIMHSDATGGWYGPFAPSIDKAREQKKPLIWRSATGQWITPEPMTAYEGLWRFGERRFPTRFFHAVTANWLRFINGQPGSMKIKGNMAYRYSEGLQRTPLPQPPKLTA